MPKLKTRKAAAKRIKVTGSGKLLRGQVMMSHLKTKKSAQRKRRKSGYVELSKADRKKIKRLLPYL